MVFDNEGKPVDYVFIRVNRAFEEMTGLAGREIAGRKVTEVLPGIRDEPFDWIGTYGKVVLTGEEARFERHFAPLDKWYSILAYRPEPGHFAVIFEDVTERRRAGEEVRRTAERLREACRLGRLGWWEFDVGANAIAWTDAVYDLFERDRALGPPTPEEEARRGGEGYADHAKKFIPNRRGGVPRDIAGAALFLASELGDYVNGETILVDGGLLAGCTPDWDAVLPTLERWMAGR